MWDVPAARVLLAEEAVVCVRTAAQVLAMCSTYDGGIGGMT